MEWILAIVFVWCIVATAFWVRDRDILGIKDAEIEYLSGKIKCRESYINDLSDEIEHLKSTTPYATTWYRDGQGCVTEAIPKGEYIPGAFKPLHYSGQLVIKADKGIRMNENYVKPVYSKNGVAVSSGRIANNDSSPVLNLDNWDFITGFAASDSDSKKPVVSDVCESTPSYGSIVEVNDCSSSYDSGIGSCDSGSSDSFGGND